MGARKVVFSFTTSPTRIKKCGTMIRSILYQTVRPDLILLNIPEVFERTGEYYEIPDEVNELVTVNICEHDYGPGTKIVPTITYLRENEWDEDTMIIYGDDDIRYLPKMIETYLSLPDESVWCVAGFNFVDYNVNASLVHGNKVTIAEGYGSVCGSLSFFESDFEEYMRKLSETNDFKFSDDVTISNYLWRKGVPINICNVKDRLGCKLLWQRQSILNYGKEQDALHKGASGITSNNVDRYKRIIDTLTNSKERHFPIFSLRRQWGLRT